MRPMEKNIPDNTQPLLRCVTVRRCLYGRGSDVYGRVVGGSKSLRRRYPKLYRASQSIMPVGRRRVPVFSSGSGKDCGPARQRISSAPDLSGGPEPHPRASSVAYAKLLIEIRTLGCIGGSVANA